MTEKIKRISDYVNPGTILVSIGLGILFFNLRSTYQAGLRNQVYSRYNSCALSRVLIIPNAEREKRKSAAAQCWKEVQGDVGVQVKQYNKEGLYGL